jgi:hypothetical protein
MNSLNREGAGNGSLFSSKPLTLQANHFKV